MPGHYVLAHLSAYLTAIITHHYQYVVYNQYSTYSLTFASNNKVARDLKYRNYGLQRPVTSVKLCHDNYDLIEWTMHYILTTWWSEVKLDWQQKFWLQIRASYVIHKNIWRKPKFCMISLSDRQFWQWVSSRFLRLLNQKAPNLACILHSPYKNKFLQSWIGLRLSRYKNIKWFCVCSIRAFHEFPIDPCNEPPVWFMIKVLKFISNQINYKTALIIQSSAIPQICRKWLSWEQWCKIAILCNQTSVIITLCRKHAEFNGEKSFFICHILTELWAKVHMEVYDVLHYSNMI